MSGCYTILYNNYMIHTLFPPAYFVKAKNFNFLYYRNTIIKRL